MRATRWFRGEAPAASAQRGALWLALLLVALGLPWGDTSFSSGEGAGCLAAERAAVEGRTTLVSCSDASVAEAGGAVLRGPARWLFGERVALDTARASWLEAIPGIGPARARVIVDAQRAAPLASVRELERLPGIGPATRRVLEAWLAPVASKRALDRAASPQASGAAGVRS